MSLLDLVALGTVADVARAPRAQPGDGRAGAERSWQARKHRHGRLDRCERLNRAPSCSDLGFALGPRINAGGRVGEATLGVRLLTTEDADEARAIAASSRSSTRSAAGSKAKCKRRAEAQLAAQHNRAVLVLAERAGIRA